MKIDIEEIQAKLLEKNVDPKKVSEIIKELEEVAEEIKEDKKANSLPKAKNEFLIILNDKDDFLKGKEIAGWIVQKPLDDDANLVLGKLVDAAKNQNEAAKRKKNTITDFTQLFEFLKPKFTKEKNLKIKTKELTRVIITNGKFI